MARLPDELIARIKKEVPITELCNEYGIELTGSGKNLLAKCPLHDDDKPSFVVTPEKNLWNCLAGCGGGDNIKLVMEMEKLSFRHAADKLAARIGVVPEAQTLETRSGTTHDILVDPASGLTDASLLQNVSTFYHQTFMNQPQAMQYLQKRKCFHPEAVKLFKIGYANRTIGYRVPKTTKAGQQLKEQLTKIGIYGRKGHEHLRGSVVFPIFDRQGDIVQMYGRKTNDHLRAGTPPHLYLEGKKQGVWNRQGIEKQREWLLCESIIDALTFWCHGFRNATCAFGVNGFNENLWELLNEAKPQKIVICYDNDKAGNKAAEQLAVRLTEQSIAAYRVKLPDKQDINSMAVSSQDPSKTLDNLIEDAKPLGAMGALGKQQEPAQEQPSLLAAPETKLPSSESLTKKGKDELHMTLGDRHYRIRGMSKNMSYESLKIQLKLTFEDNFHLDNGFDLCAFKAREGFVKAAVIETGLRADVLKRDLGKLLLELETLQEEQIRKATEPESIKVEIDYEDQQTALDLLKSPNLLDRILTDFNACGVIGEDTNKLVGYLGATSRKFSKPLGIIVQSTSAAGKTTLMESILAFMPDEERVKYSAMTGQALFYLGETNIKHKILAIAEEEGAERATYALKLLQSEGELTIASTGKDATTGRMQTEEYHVEGPAMIFFTTTNIEIDEELANRCLTLTVDESREQTKRIHQLQREARTLEGMEKKYRKKAILHMHKNAQRLIEPLEVINPYASQLTFPDENTRLRRDQEKYLTLIDTIALLHQHQRPVKERGGKQYIEVSKEDIANANRLAGESFGRTLDEMPPQTRRFIGLLWDMVKSIAKDKELDLDQVRFSQREAREVTGWSQMQVKRHLAKLAELEYLIVHSGGRGQSWSYELIYQGEGEEGNRFVLGLIDPTKLEYDQKWGIQNDKRGISGAHQGHARGIGGSPPENPPKPIENNASSDADVKTPARKEQAHA